MVGVSSTNPWRLKDASGTLSPTPLEKASPTDTLRERTAELVALKWSQVDLSEGYIDIHRLKNGHDTVHPLRAPELRALRQLQRDYPDTPYVFVSERKAPLSTRAVRHILSFLQLNLRLIPLIPRYQGKFHLVCDQSAKNLSIL